MSHDDPERLLDSGDTTAGVRDLIRSGIDADPPQDARAAVWGALATRLPGVGGAGGGGAAGPGPGAGAGAAGAAGASTAIKAVGALALLGLVAGGAGIAFNAKSPALASPSAIPAVTPPSSTIEPGTSAAITSTAVAPAATANEPPPERASTPIASAAPSFVPAVPRGKATGATATSSPPASHADLRDEAALLASAREAVQGGDARRALSILDEARQKHPTGVLVQEREVVAIEALARGGDKAAASRRAEAFLRAFPGSPHASHVRTYAVR